MKIKRLLLMSGAWLGFWHGLAMADTDFILPQPTDPKAAPVVVSARNFDADHNLRYFAEVMPRGRVWHASDPDAGAGKYGWSWTNQYGFVGISYGWSANYNRGRHLDGMNEKGLSAAVIEFNDSDSLFPQPSTGNTNLSIRSVVAWVLGNFSTVQEVTNSISALQVWQEPTGYFLTFNNALQLVVHDTNSHSIVVEWFPDGPTIRGTYWVDEMRAASGDPDYVSLYGYGQNYADLNWENHMKVPVNNEMVNITDHYLPGDSWSPSRFVRANR
ncbi:MAG: linear amide C-N hydrolase, partial [bacterium]